MPAVRNVWDCQVPGFSMFSVVSKLKLLKTSFRKMKYAQGNLASNSKKCRDDLCRIQSEMVQNSSNDNLRNAEMAALNAYKVDIKDE